MAAYIATSLVISVGFCIEWAQRRYAQCARERTAER